MNITEKLDSMLRVARAATPGPWLNDSNFFAVYADDGDEDSQEIPICDTDVGGAEGEDACEANAEHIAQSNPAAFIALVESLREAVVGLELCLENLSKINASADLNEIRYRADAVIPSTRESLAAINAKIGEL